MGKKKFLAIVSSIIFLLAAIATIADFCRNITNTNNVVTTNIIQQSAVVRPQDSNSITLVDTSEAKITSKLPEVTAMQNNNQKTDNLYYIEKTLKEGESFIDEKTNVTICFNDIHTDKTADGILNLPNHSEKDISNIKPGRKWEFVFKNTKYELIVKEINFIYDSYKIILKEK
jgi:hypothetical protein